MYMRFEYELNRAWIYDEERNTIGETNFVVPADWLKELYDKEFSDKYTDFELFLEVYEPQIDGEFIYQKALEDNVLVEDLGIVYYKDGEKNE